MWRRTAVSIIKSTFHGAYSKIMRLRPLSIHYKRASLSELQNRLHSGCHIWSVRICTNRQSKGPKLTVPALLYKGLCNLENWKGLIFWKQNGFLWDVGLVKCLSAPLGDILLIMKFSSSEMRTRVVALAVRAALALRSPDPLLCFVRSLLRLGGGASWDGWRQMEQEDSQSAPGAESSRCQ